MAHLQQILAGDDGLSRQARNRRDRKVRRWVDQATGVCHTHLELDVEATPASPPPWTPPSPPPGPSRKNPT